MTVNNKINYPYAQDSEQISCALRVEHVAFRRSINCALLETPFKVSTRRHLVMSVSTPFFFSDGDSFNVLVQPMTGVSKLVLITDLGLNDMHWSMRSFTEYGERERNEAETRRIISQCGGEWTDGAITMLAPLTDLDVCVMRYCVMIELISATRGWATWPPKLEPTAVSSQENIDLGF